MTMTNPKPSHLCYIFVLKKNSPGQLQAFTHGQSIPEPLRTVLVMATYEIAQILLALAINTGFPDAAPLPLSCFQHIDDAYNRKFESTKHTGLDEIGAWCVYIIQLSLIICDITSL